MPIIDHSQGSPEPSNKFSQLLSIIRRDAVRYQTVAGHRFVTILLIQPTYCSRCGDFIWGAWSYSCESCKLVCHSKCVNRIEATCVNDLATFGSAQVGRQSSSDHQPNGHEFKGKAFLRPTYCDHCGTLITYKKSNIKNLTLKQGLECEHCKMKIHDECKKFVCYNCNHHRTKDGYKNSEQPFSHRSTISLDDFEILGLIGTGSFSKVYLAKLRNAVDRKTFAIKVIKKTDPVIGSDPGSVFSEKRTLYIGRMCPFLITAHCCFQSVDRLYLVMEHVVGRDLLYFLPKFRENDNENHTRFYAAEIVLALKFLHSRAIIYRDLKLENVIIDQHGHCKLIDLGMVKELFKIPNGKTRTFCGTPNYISPEIIRELDYDYSVDWWTLGVLMYELLVGISPFEAESDRDLYSSITNDEIDIPKGCNLSHEADFILRDLLTKEPSQRLGCQIMNDIKEHPFFTSPTKKGSKVYQWAAIEDKSIEPPFRSTSKDLKNADELGENSGMSPVSPRQLEQISQRDFEDFSYYSESFRSLARIDPY